MVIASLRVALDIEDPEGGTMHRPFAFRTPVAIPDLGAEPGDWIEYSTRRPHHVYLIRALPRDRAMDVFRRMGTVVDSVPGLDVEVGPVGKRMEVVR